MGKFAHMCLQTREHRLQRPAVHGERRRRQQEGVRHRPRRQPLDRHPRRRGDLVAGANVAECAPITTNYVWQAREQGAKVIVVDPRITPIARTCDLFLPVKPGRDAALFNGILHLMIEHDWLDHAFIERHTVGFDAVAEYVREWTPQRTAEVTGIAEKSIEQAAEWWGTAKTSFLCTRAASSTTATACRTCWARSTSSWRPAASAAEHCGYATITGQANGQGGREHGQKCDQLPGGRDLANPEHRAYVAGVWGMDARGAAAARRRRLRDLPQDRSRRDQGAAQHLLQPGGLAARQQLRAPGAREARVLRRDRLLPERDARATPTSCCPARCRRRTRARSPSSKAASSRSTRPSTARATRGATGVIIQDIARRWAASSGLTFESPREIFEELRVASQGRRRRLLGHHLRKRSSEHFGVFWPCPSERAGRGARTAARRGRRGSSSPDRGTRSPRAPARSTSPTARPASTSRPTPVRPRTWTRSIPIILTTGRVVSQFLSGNQTRRIGPLVDHTPSRASRFTRGWRRRSASPTATGPRRRAAAAPARCKALGRDDDPPRHRVHPVSLGRAQERQPAHDRRAGPDLEDSRVQGLRRAGPQGRRRRRSTPALLEPQQ